MFDEFERTAKLIVDSARRDGRLIENLSDDLLRKLSLEEPGSRETNYGSISVETEPTSRAAMHTKNNIDSKFGDEEYRLLSSAEAELKKHKLLVCDVEVGDGSQGIYARLIVPERFAHIAYGGTKLFRRVHERDPTYYVIFFYDDKFENNRTRNLPDKEIMIRNAHSRDGKLVKLIKNSNYTGEWKKGVFAGEDYRAKQKGCGLFLHAGCRQDFLEMSHGGYKTQTSLFVALSANGKTSLTCKVMARKGREKSWLVQDDGGILGMDGSFRGFEPGGIYVKTDGLNPSDQVETYYATLRPETFLENVHVDDDGDVDFYNIERTSNGRAVIERRDFMHSSRSINAERVDNIFIISRGSVIPAIAKLTPEEATAFMVIGQSMESSAGDPTSTGQIKNVFFYDPFIAGSKADHANIFYEILQRNPHISCYLLNTGSIGEGYNYHKITLQETVGILDSVFRGGLEDWMKSATGLTVPRSLRLVDSIVVHPERLYRSSDFEREQKELNTHRAEIMDRYPDIDRKIREVFQK